MKFYNQKSVLKQFYLFAIAFYNIYEANSSFDSLRSL